MTAPLSSRLFMIPIELPSYLSTAYALRFKEVDNQGNFIQRIVQVVRQTWQLIHELLNFKPNLLTFRHNAEKLETDFQSLNEKVKDSNKPICAYFVSSTDHNGSILGNHLYYYHHYKIRKFERHYAVVAKVVKTTEEMFQFLHQVKEEYKDRPIKVVDIVAHGDNKSISITKETHTGRCYSNVHVQENEFRDCAPDAAIILDACSVGQGNKSIAETIAQKNPGKKVFAPGTSLFFSKPIIYEKDRQPSLEHVVHGFAIVRAYTSRTFRFLTT